MRLCCQSLLKLCTPPPPALYSDPIRTIGKALLCNSLGSHRATAEGKVLVTLVRHSPKRNTPVLLCHRSKGWIIKANTEWCKLSDGTQCAEDGMHCCCCCSNLEGCKVLVPLPPVSWS